MKKRVSIVAMIIFIFLTGCSNSNRFANSPREIYSYILTDDSASLESSLNKGFPLNYKNGDSVSLLKYAVLKDSKNSIALLLSKGADPNQDETAFSIRSFSVLESFIKNGLNLNQKNSFGTPLIIEYIKNKPTKYTLSLIKNGADINAHDSSGWSPLFWASVTGDIAILDTLLKNGVSPLVKDSKGNYPIYYCENEEKLSLLLKYNYNLKEVNNEGENILGETLLKAVANNQIKTINTLISKGVNIRYKSYGRGAMDIALDNNNPETISFLKSKGL